MKLKLCWILMLFVLILPTVSIAQEETDVIRACTQQEMEDVLSEIEAITAAQEAESSDDLAALQAADTAAALLAETTFAPCAEMVVFKTRLGVMLNQTVVVAGWVMLERYETGLGDLASVMHDYGMTRADTLFTAIGDYATFLGEANWTGGGDDWPACTQEQLTADSVAALNDISSAYYALTMDTEKDWLTLMTDYAELSIEYWDEIYPELPNCPSVLESGSRLGQMIDESLLITMLDVMMIFETDTEITAIYSEMRAAHAEILQELTEFDLGIAESE